MSELTYTEDPAEVARQIDALIEASVDNHIAEDKTPRTVHAEQAKLQNEVHRVWFRAGLLACREYMARFVAAESPTIAASIRANWWPDLGEDPGGPRRLHWDEVADGGEDGPWTARNPGASVEALPVALQFLCAGAQMDPRDYEATVPNRKAHNVLIHRTARLFAQVRWNDGLGGIFGELTMYESPYQKEETEDLIKQINDAEGVIERLRTLLADLKAWDVAQYMAIPHELRERMQREIGNDE